MKWKGYRQTSWEPLENILDPSLITKYYHDHPRARNIVPHASLTPDPDSSDIPVIAAFSPCFRQPPSISAGPTDEPTSPFDQTVTPMLQRPRLFSKKASPCCSLWPFIQAPSVPVNLTQQANHLPFTLIL